MIYKAKPGSSLKDKDAAIIGEAIATIEKQEGQVSAESLVERATPAKSTLHRFFDWDDAHAAAIHRTDQARLLIRSIVIVRSDREENPRAFVSVNRETTTTGGGKKREDGRVYISTVRALSNTEWREEVITRAWQELESFVRKYHELSEFAEIVKVIEEKKSKRAS